MSGATAQESTACPASRIGPYDFEEFVEAARQFHGYPAPGLLLGGFMVQRALDELPTGKLLDAISETSWCLPDAVQMLTPCSIGNGWLRILNLGLYAVSLYDKFTGEGVRVYLDPARLAQCPNMLDWYLKRKEKRDQDSKALRREIQRMGASVCGLERVKVKTALLHKRGKGGIVCCPVCGEAYPRLHGAICRSCQGETPYAKRSGRGLAVADAGPELAAMPVADAVGHTALHDMTRIEPGVSKDAEVTRGQTLEAGDVCRLQRMGRNRVYVDQAVNGADWVHEDVAAEAFAEALAGPGVVPNGGPREGKVTLQAVMGGLFVVDEERLERLNLMPDVMAAVRRNHSLVKTGAEVAGTRAIPLYLSRDTFTRAMRLLEDGPILTVRPLARPDVGIVVTGEEVASGLVEDRFEQVITAKLRRFGCRVAGARLVGDDREAIADAVRNFVADGCDLIVTTAGLSVDPDDVTRQALVDAGAEDILYGAPVLPGTMSLLARVGPARLMGVPACALFFRTTAFDLLLPRVLAGLDITRKDLAQLANGGLCQHCRRCSYPKCRFG